VGLFGLRVSRSQSETARLEAFSDGVLAIAITLLVLDINIPHGGDVGHELRAAWPQYLAYLTAFLTIAVLWANHHDVFRIIAATDRGLMFANSLLLASISFLPFPTRVLADNMRSSGSDRQAALLAYGATMVVIAICFNIFWRYACHRGLVSDEVPPSTIAEINRAYAFGPIIYGAAMLLSFFAAWLSVAVWLGFAVFWQLFGYDPE
jgi:TMEM175 potassium channel family protein